MHSAGISVFFKEFFVYSQGGYHQSEDVEKSGDNPW
jgi:hypothetical protein